MRPAATISLVSLLTAVAVPVLLARQVAEPTRREPPPRTIEVPGEKTEKEAQDARQSQELPKIELPEYVITGIASIDLPDMITETQRANLHNLSNAYHMLLDNKYGETV